MKNFHPKPLQCNDVYTYIRFSPRKLAQLAKEVRGHLGGKIGCMQNPSTGGEGIGVERSMLVRRRGGRKCKYLLYKRSVFLWLAE